MYIYIFMHMCIYTYIIIDNYIYAIFLLFPFRYLLDSLHIEMAGGDEGGEREAEEEAQADSGWSTGRCMSVYTAGY